MSLKIQGFNKGSFLVTRFLRINTVNIIFKCVNLNDTADLRAVKRN